MRTKTKKGNRLNKRKETNLGLSTKKETQTKVWTLWTTITTSAPATSEISLLSRKALCHDDDQTFICFEERERHEK